MPKENAGASSLAKGCKGKARSPAKGSTCGRNSATPTTKNQLDDRNTCPEPDGWLNQGQKEGLSGRLRNLPNLPNGKTRIFAPRGPSAGPWRAPKGAKLRKDWGTRNLFNTTWGKQLGRSFEAMGGKWYLVTKCSTSFRPLYSCHYFGDPR